MRSRRHFWASYEWQWWDSRFDARYPGWNYVFSTNCVCSCLKETRFGVSVCQLIDWVQWKRVIDMESILLGESEIDFLESKWVPATNLSPSCSVYASRTRPWCVLSVTSSVSNCIHFAQVLFKMVFLKLALSRRRFEKNFSI